MTTVGVGVLFNFATGTVDVLMDSRDRSGASKHLYAKPDLHLFKLLLKGVLVGGFDIAVTSKLKLAESFVSKASIGLGLSAFTDKAYDAFFGGQYVVINFTESKNSDVVLERKYTVDDSLKDTLAHHWGDIGKDINTLRLDRVIISTNDSGGNIIYYKVFPNSDYENTYSFSAYKEEHFIEFLKRMQFSVNGERVHVSKDKGAKPVQILQNYYSSNSDVMQDLRSNNEKYSKYAAYALENLKGYVLENHKQAQEYLNVNLYSDKHLKDRITMLDAIMYDKVSDWYVDQKTGITTKLLNGPTDIRNVRKTVFVHDSFSENNVASFFFKKYTFYGNSKNNNIDISGDADMYVEGGLGNDTITTGDGDDTIYTNLNLKSGSDKVDNETSSTENRVEAGGGDDKIFGSNGKDTLKGGSGYDTYHVGDKDIIEDIDHKGEVHFGDLLLKGGKWNGKAYIGTQEEEYTLSGNTLKVKKGNDTLTINNYDRKKQSLGIKLEETVDIKVEGDEVLESDGSLTFKITLSQASSQDIALDLFTKNNTANSGSDYVSLKKSITIKAGEIKKQVNVTIINDKIKEKTEDFYLQVNHKEIDQDIDVKINPQSAKGIILDDDSDDPDDPGLGSHEDNHHNQIIYDPIALDLNNNGKIDILPYSANNVYFDHDGDNIAVKTSWIDKEDGILTYDKNDDNTINNGNELFGNFYDIKTDDGNTRLALNGFEALKTFDTNDDGIIDEKDKDFDKLKVWKDENSDGISQSTELSSLKDLQIKSLNLNYEDVNENLEDDNILAQKSSFTKEDGATSIMADINFSVDTMHSNYTDTISLDEQESNRLEVEGLGTLRDLRQAATLNSNLASLLDEYVSPITREQRKALVPQILEQWSKTSPKYEDYNHNIGFSTPSDESGHRDVRLTPSQARNLKPLDSNHYLIKEFDKIKYKISVIDTFTGRTTNNLYYVLPSDIETIINKINKTYEQIVNNVYDVLTPQIHLKEYGSINNHDKVIENFQAIYNSNPKKAFVDLSEFIFLANDTTKLQREIRLLNTFLTDIKSNYKIREYMDLLPSEIKDKLFRLDGTSGNDNMIGGYNQNYINAGSGNDVIQGNEGNDIMSGNDGSDTYIVGKNDGNDIIKNYDASEARTDSIKFIDGIKKQDITLKRVDNNLLIHIKGQSDFITIENMFFENGDKFYHSIDKIIFENSNEIINLEDILNRVVQGTDKDDIMLGFNSKDDKLNGGKGNDSIKSFDGNDTIQTGLGNDTIDAGSGNDVVNGGKGNDSYVYGNDFGHDTILNFNQGQDIDTIKFTDGIRKDDLIFKRIVKNKQITNDLIIIKDDNNSITIGNFFSGGEVSREYKIDFIEFDDGAKLNVEDLKALVLLSTDGDDILSAYEEGSTINGDSGNDVIYGDIGNDTLNGGDGDDSIYGNDGDDSILGGDGNDIVEGNGGSDILTGGTGNDTLNAGEDNDIYIFGKNFGNDIINNHDISSDRIDTIKFTDGIKKDDLIFKRIVKNKQIENDLIISSKDKNNSITIKNFFNKNKVNNEYKIDFIEFDDGAKLNVEDLKALVLLSTDGNDILSAYEEGSAINGDSGNDVIYGDIGNDTLNGGDGDDSIYGNEGDDDISGGYGDDEISGGSGKDVISAGAGNDIIFGDTGDDSIIGGDGNDVIEGDEGNDTIIGGNGNDILDAGDGNDTYTFGKNFGNDIIANNDTSKNRIDTIKFIDNITKDDLIYRRSIEGNYTTNDLIISTKDDKNTLTVKNFFDGNKVNDEYKIDFIKFDDNTTLNVEDLKALALLPTKDNDILSAYEEGSIINGDSGDDILYGNKSKDTLNGEEGNDTIYGNDGDDNILGGDGDDEISGGTGNDNITAGEGNDILNAGEGNDVYIFSKNFGHDTIDNYDISNNRIDTIKFIDGIKQDDLTYRRSTNDTYTTNDLIIFSKDKNNSITIKNFFDGNKVNDEYKIDFIKFDDNTTLNVEDLKALALLPTKDNDILSAYEEGSIINGDSGDDILYGNKSKDTLNGEEGNDTIYGYDGDDNISGGDGNDTIYGNEGNDSIDAGDGDDTIIGGVGNDTIYGDEGNDIISDFSGKNTIYGNDGDDTITGKFDINGGKIDILNGGFGNDTITGSGILIGEDGDDTLKTSIKDPYDYDVQSDAQTNTLNGGKGNDIFYGSAYNEIYKFSKGDGEDTVYEREVIDPKYVHKDSFDIVRFDESVSKENIELFRVNNDLIIENKTSSDKVTVKNYFFLPNTYFKVNQISFSDGTTYDATYIENNAIYLGTNEDETLVGYKDNHDIIKGLGGNDKLFGFNGDDTIYGGNGNDYLSGGSGNQSNTGNDTLMGEEGNDTLVGEDGDDTLIGGSGDDSYIYTNNHGFDIIDNTGGGKDILFFNDITRDRLSFKKDNNDLIVLVDNNSETGVRVKNHFLGGDYAIDYIQPHKSYMLSTQKINNLVKANETNGEFQSVVEGTDGNDKQLVGTNEKDLIKGFNGDDSLFGFSGDDTLEGGEGNDYLSGGSGSYTNTGNDTLKGGAGNDTLVGEDGDDTLIGGSGDDSYIYTNNHGFDIIDNTGGGKDILFFNDIIKDRLSFKKEDNDLVILVDNNPKTGVRVKNHFLGGDYAIDYIQPHKSYMLSTQKINNLVTNNSENDSSDNNNSGNEDNPNHPSDTSLVGGKEDNVFTYNGGKVSVSDTGGMDRININQSGSNVYYVSNGKDLFVSLKPINEANKDVLEVKNFFSDKNAIIENFTLKNGYNITAQSIYKKFNKPYPDISSNNDSNTDNTQEDNELQLPIPSHLKRKSGTDSNNIIWGSKKDDLIIGKKGDDTLKGNKGDDMYFFSKGDGNDVIKDAYFSWFKYRDAGDDTIRFDRGIKKEDISFIQDKYGNLNIKYSSTDTITIKNQTDDNRSIERIELNDGSFLTDTTIQKIIHDMNAYATDNGIQLSHENIRNNDDMIQIVMSGWNG